MLETVTRDDAHFSMSFWIFELIHIVFELEQIYVIYIFNASMRSRFPKIDSVPLKLETCILLFEDEYFHFHPGVNPVSIGRAIWQNLSSRKVKSGASTLTMQTIRLSRKNPSRTYLEKLLEMYLAFRLEFSFSKKEIQKKYFNKKSMFVIFFIGKFPALKKLLYTIFDMKELAAQKRIEQLKSQIWEANTAYFNEDKAKSLSPDFKHENLGKK